MSNIQTLLEQIRLARYGKDVRQAIHDSIHQCYEDGKAGEVDLIAREGVVALERDVAEIKEDMAALDSKVETFGIAITKENTIKGTKHGGFRLTKMLANTIQNGTPSPSTPFPLLSTGDCVEMIQGYWKGNTGTYDASLPYACCTKNKIPCKSGDVVKVMTETKYSIATVYYDNRGNLSGEDLENDTASAEFTVPSGASYLHLDIIDYTQVMRVDTVGKITITINGKYLGCAKTRSKNLFDGKFKGRLMGDGIVSTADNYLSTDFIKVEKNTSYYFSHICGTNSAVPIAIYDVNRNYLRFKAVGVYDNSSGVVSFEDDVAYIRVSAPIGLETQVEIGDTATDYVPSGETIAWYTTQYPMIKGSTLFRENGLVKMEHKNMPFSVNENSDISAWGGSYPHLFKVTLAEANETTSDIMCSHFQTYEEVGAVFTKDMIYTINGALSVNHLASSNVSEFKAWLSNNPIYGIAPRKTPIVETLDTVSQIALNGVETFDGMTYVEFDTRIPPLEFEAEVGTSQVGAYTLKSLNNSESNAVKIEDAVSTMLMVGA